MEIQKSTGIVLSAAAIGEADKLSRIFTLENGKRNFIFKGLRKSKRRGLIVTEPGTLVELIYYFNEKKDFFIVNEFNIINSYLKIRDNIESILNLFYLLEITEKTTGFNDPNTNIFNLLFSGIETLSRTEHVLPLSLFFSFHLMKLHGILPAYNCCKLCNNSDFNEFIIDFADSAFICRSCFEHKNVIKNKIFLRSAHRELIQQIINNKFLAIKNIYFNSVYIIDVLQYYIEFIENYFQVKIKSKNMILPVVK